MNWHPQIRHHTGVSKVPSASMEENQIRDPSCLFSPSNSVNTNSFVKANWFCTMQFPKDVFWVKLITSHNKICFNPINVRWLCLDQMCVCFLCSLHVCALLILFARSFFTVHFLPTDLALGWMIIENPVCLYMYV